MFAGVCLCLLVLACAALVLACVDLLEVSAVLTCLVVLMLAWVCVFPCVAAVLVARG